MREKLASSCSSMPEKVEVEGSVDLALAHLADSALGGVYDAETEDRTVEPDLTDLPDERRSES